MKTEKLDNSVSRHFDERKVFFNKPLNKKFGGAQFPVTENKIYVKSYIFVFILSLYNWKTDEKTTDKYIILCKTTRSKFLVTINFLISVTEKNYL